MSDKRNMQGRTRESAGVPALGSSVALPSNYHAVLTEIKSRIQTERIRVALSANATMVLLYWDIGSGILEQQKQEGWGAKVIDRLSFDLKSSFPDMGGLSPRNLKYMRKFAESWADREVVQRTVAQILWRSNLALLDKLNALESRIWYAQKTIEKVPRVVAQLDAEPAEYALRDVHKPIGISDYDLTQALPENLKSSLPSIEEIEAELSQEMNNEE